VAGSQELGISRLAQDAGVPVRTVRFYIASRLLPSPEGRGRSAAYTEEHLDRLRLIRTLAEQRVSLAEIRETVTPLDAEEVRRILAREQRRSTDETSARSRSPREYVSALLDRARHPSSAPSQADALVTSAAIRRPEPATWRRIELADGLELHVRADTPRDFRALVERIAEFVNVERRKPDEQ
jgi:DNA-binding transcriptional MerR regulator